MQQAQQYSRRTEGTESAAQRYNVMGMVSAANAAPSGSGASTPTGSVEVGDPARSSLASVLGSVQTAGTPPPPPPPSESSSSTDGGLNSSFMDKMALVLKAKQASDSQSAANAAAALYASPSQGGVKDANSPATEIFDRLFGKIQPAASAAGA